MKVTHRLTATCSCPVDGQPDVYAVTVRASRVIKVEDILAAVATLRGERIFQEELTARLARAIAAEVETVGHHSGVETTCIV